MVDFSKATKRPWRLGEEDWFADCPFLPIYELEPTDFKIAEVVPRNGEDIQDIDQANAALIVHAVNLHDDLVKALEKAHAALMMKGKLDLASEIDELLSRAKGNMP